MPTIVDVSTVVLSSWMPNWRAVAFWLPNAIAEPGDQDELSVVVVVEHAGPGQD